MLYFTIHPGKCFWCSGMVVRRSWDGRVICYFGCPEDRYYAAMHKYMVADTPANSRDVLFWDRMRRMEDQSDLLSV